MATMNTCECGQPGTEVCFKPGTTEEIWFCTSRKHNARVRELAAERLEVTVGHYRGESDGDRDPTQVSEFLTDLSVPARIRVHVASKENTDSTHARVTAVRFRASEQAPENGPRGCGLGHVPAVPI
jgi:hypothetical protein